MRTTIGRIIGGLALAAAVAACSATTPVGLGRVPVPLTSSSEHELRGIYLACDEAARVREAVIPRASLGRMRSTWADLRGSSASLAERNAVHVWDMLIESVDDPAALDDLFSACRRSGY